MSVSKVCRASLPATAMALNRAWASARRSSLRLRRSGSEIAAALAFQAAKCGGHERENEEHLVAFHYS